PNSATEGPKIFPIQGIFQRGSYYAHLCRQNRVLARFAVARAALAVQRSRRQTNASPAVQQRMKWQDFVSGPDGAKRLASLTAAVAKMKSLDNSPADSADFRRSWKYWAN